MRNVKLGPICLHDYVKERHFCGISLRQTRYKSFKLLVHQSQLIINFIVVLIIFLHSIIYVRYKFLACITISSDFNSKTEHIKVEMCATEKMHIVTLAKKEIYI